MIRLPLLCLTAFAALSLGARSAHATIIAGIEFTDPIVVDTVAGQDLVLGTSEDLYVFIPNDLVVTRATITAGSEIHVLEGARINATLEVSLCGGGDPDCVFGAFDFDSDVWLRIFDPLGDIDVSAGGSIVIAREPLPEASLAGLSAAALAVAALTRRCAGRR